MCEITSIGEMSAARTTIPELALAAVAPVGDLRSALTTSFTPRFRDLFLAAIKEGLLAFSSVSLLQRQLIAKEGVA